MSGQNLNEDNKSGASMLKSKPILLYSGFISKESEWYSAEHSHPFCEIAFICSGSGQFTIDDNTFIGHKGDILIYNALVLHEEYSIPSDPLEMYYCAIDNIHIDGLQEEHIIPDSFTPLIKAGEFTFMLENYFNALVTESSSKQTDYETMCSNLLSCIIISILRFIQIPQKELQEQVAPNSGKSTQLYIDQNFTQDITLSKLSKVFYMSKDYISHVFKNEIGYSPIKYLMIRRVEEAKKLLASTDLSVNEISLSVGYEDANYFSVIFKKVTGLTPVQYRKDNKLNQ